MRGRALMFSEAGALEPAGKTFLGEISALAARLQRPPLAPELSRHLELQPRTLQYRLDKAAQAGYVSISGTDRTRSISLTEKARAALQTGPALGRIRNRRLEKPMPVNPVHCGALAPTASEPTFIVEYFADIFPSYRDGDTLFIAQGDSMLSADPSVESIFPGDRLLLRPGIWPGTGEIVLVEYESTPGLRECTLKEWHQDGKTVTLMPRNSLYDPITRDIDDIIVRGVVLDVVRCVRGK